MSSSENTPCTRDGCYTNGPHEHRTGATINVGALGASGQCECNRRCGSCGHLLMAHDEYGCVLESCQCPSTSSGRKIEPIPLTIDLVFVFATMIGIPVAAYFAEGVNAAAFGALAWCVGASAGLRLGRHEAARHV
jgi:hypothetical protein